MPWSSARWPGTAAISSAAYKRSPARPWSALPSPPSPTPTCRPASRCAAPPILMTSWKTVGTTQDYSAGSTLRYRVLRPHAKGGLGEVFVASDQELHREVALKEIQTRHAHDTNSRGRFVLEAEITGRLEHPGIVPVYGLGSYADGRPFYAMRFITAIIRTASAE